MQRAAPSSSSCREKDSLLMRARSGRMITAIWSSRPSRGLPFLRLLINFGTDTRVDGLLMRFGTGNKVFGLHSDESLLCINMKTDDGKSTEEPQIVFRTIVTGTRYWKTKIKGFTGVWTA